MVSTDTIIAFWTRKVKMGNNFFLFLVVNRYTTVRGEIEGRGASLYYIPHTGRRERFMNALQVFNYSDQPSG